MTIKTLSLVRVVRTSMAALSTASVVYKEFLMRSRKKQIACLAVAASIAAAASGQPSTTTVTYQGVLKNGATPVADSSYALTFKIYDAGTGGTVVETIVLPSIQTKAGQFTAAVPVSPSSFNGADRWWTVTFNGVEMLPRQKITATPYAMQTRGLFVDSSLRVGIGNTSPQQRCVVGTTTSAGRNRMPAMTEALTIGSGSAALGTKTGLLFENGNSSAAAIVVEKQNEFGEDVNYMRFFTVRDSEPNAVERMTLNQFGCLGIGTTNPRRRLVAGTTSQSIDRLSGLAANGTYLTEAITVGTNHTGAGTAVGLVFETNSRTAGAILAEKRADGSNEDSSLRFYAIKEGDPQPRLCMSIFPERRVEMPVLTITGGSDLAEPFLVSPGKGAEVGPKPGMVMSIDPANPGALRVATDAYDTRVAGVYSGGNNLPTGMIMGKEGCDLTAPGEGKVPLAMTGRVWVFADESSGQIKPGDRLTTSGLKPGHAMKVIDDVKAPGTVIGKAMTGIDPQTGMWYTSPTGVFVGSTGNSVLNIQSMLAVYDAIRQSGNNYHFRLQFMNPDHHTGDDPQDPMSWAIAQARGVGIYGRVEPIGTTLYAVQYYMAFGYNNTTAPPLCGDVEPGTHEGDWICADFTVDVADINAPRIVQAIYHNHGRQVFVESSGALRFEGTHPVMYLEQGCNEPWPFAGEEGFTGAGPPPCISTNKIWNPTDGGPLAGC